jgi:hypothetical protein
MPTSALDCAVYRILYLHNHNHNHNQSTTTSTSTSTSTTDSISPSSTRDHLQRVISAQTARQPTHHEVDFSANKRLCRSLGPKTPCSLFNPILLRYFNKLTIEIAFPISRSRSRSSSTKINRSSLPASLSQSACSQRRRNTSERLAAEIGRVRQAAFSDC